MGDPELTRSVDEFLKRTGVTPTEFGVLALKDPVFVKDLRDGREPRRKTRQRVLDFMSKYKDRAA